jgi:hypothetical protein
MQEVPCKHLGRILDANCMQAVEGSQTSTSPSKFVMLENTVRGKAADNVVFHVAAWGGGLWGAGKVVAGNFT